MQILVTGGTGFIGSALCRALTKQDHRIYILSRTAQKVTTPYIGISSLNELDPDQYFDAVINLAGEPIANKRWSHKQKQRIRSSRLDTTLALIDYFKTTEQKPKVFISGSAIGYYGVNELSKGKNDSPIAENSPGDNSFSSQLCKDWESIALEANELDIRTCILRTGIVLGNGGALSTMLTPFKMGLGGKIGSGKQWMPWIHIEDMVGIIMQCIEKDNMEGIINAVAPNPMTNYRFTKALGEQLNRPTLMAMPAFMIKILMGQMGEELLLAGKRVVPQKALNSDYHFQFELLEEALNDIL